jgi:opacity protein-like surface antigen
MKEIFMLTKTAMVKSLLAASIVSASCAASAAEMYAGGGVAVLDADEVTYNAVYGRFGAFFNENISAEARLGLGVGDDTVDGAKYELDNYYGVYVRGGIPATEIFYPYAILGFTKGKGSYSYSEVIFGEEFSESESNSESDLSYGVGADFAVTESLNINAEYMSYMDKDAGELNGFSVSVAFSF